MVGRKPTKVFRSREEYEEYERYKEQLEKEQLEKDKQRKELEDLRLEVINHRNDVSNIFFMCLVIFQLMIILFCSFLYVNTKYIDMIVKKDLLFYLRRK